MDFNFKKTGNIVNIYLKGRLDVHYSSHIEKEIGKLNAVESASHFLFNMKDVEYVSSSGLRLFVSTKRLLDESGRKLVLCNINNAVKKIFDVVEITSMFNIFGTESDALDFLNK